MAMKLSGRERRKQRIRKKIFGTPERPRLSVFRSLNHIGAQIIDDTKGVTLVSVSTCEKTLHGKVDGGNCEGAKVVGEEIAGRASARGIERVVFDRNGCLYHGRVKVFADAARQKGLKF